MSSVATLGVYIFAGIPAAIDLLYDVTALRIDTHVLMNLAVVGTLVTGLPLEGALLLVLFQSSHAVEHLLTNRAQGSLKSLYSAMPEHANVVSQLNHDGSPVMTSIQRLLAVDVPAGSTILTKPGEQVPLDGLIVHGKALVSTEHITGESLPTLKCAGDDIPAGSLCHDGVLVVRTTRVASDSTPARIAQLARDAQARRPRLRTWLDSFGEIYSKAVIATACAACCVMLAAGVPFGGTGALYRSMGLLTVASPCALVMVPLAYVSAIASAASRGVLLKGGRVLDAIERCRVVCVDKTGTLTTGRLGVSNIVHISSQDVEPRQQIGIEEERVEQDQQMDMYSQSMERAMTAATALSLRSTHPVSSAIVRAATMSMDVNAADVRVDDFTLTPGGGVQGIIHLPETKGADGHLDRNSRNETMYNAWFGSLEFVSDRLTPTEREQMHQQSMHNHTLYSSIRSVLVLEPAVHGELGNGDTMVCHSNDQRAVWAFVFEDSLRKASVDSIKILREGSWANGMPSVTRACSVAMLTGDGQASAERVAAETGIDTVYAQLDPEDKLEMIARLKGSISLQQHADNEAKSTHRNDSNRPKVGAVEGLQNVSQGVIMIGDGLNDAAALAAADVGIAIAGPTVAAASLAADAIVMNESVGVSVVPYLLRVARATRHVLYQNIALAAGSIAVLALPTMLGFIPLWVAVIFHEGSTLLVALNSLRLLRFSGGEMTQGFSVPGSMGKREEYSLMSRLLLGWKKKEMMVVAPAASPVV